MVKLQRCVGCGKFEPADSGIDTCTQCGCHGSFETIDGRSVNKLFSLYDYEVYDVKHKWMVGIAPEGYTLTIINDREDANDVMEMMIRLDIIKKVCGQDTVDAMTRLDKIRRMSKGKLYVCGIS